jgi:hypothetical protein
MLGDLTRYPFTDSHLKAAPTEQGVYVLWEGTEITKVGLAASPAGIRGELVALYTGKRTCPCKPTHYGWLVASDPIAQADGLLREHARYFTEMPRCNKA